VSTPFWDPSTIAVEKDASTLLQGLDAPERRRCCLVVYSGPDLGRQLRLEEGVSSLGRSAVATLQIDGADISRVHAEITVVGNAATLRDLDSANGSFVQDTRLASAGVLLADGDLLRLGSVILKFYAHRSLDAALHDRVYRLATLDVGTGLFNRRYLLDMLRRECRSARQTGRPLSLVAYDLDHFKRVNDRFGHGGGDLVLRECANVATGVVLHSGILGRTGGEEFIVVLPGLALPAARALAERLRQAVAAHGVDLPVGEGALRRTVSHRQTISLGVAEFSSAMIDANDLLEAADRLLYQAKEGGRDRVSG
jgi:two-component system cell cycle response regulator